MMRRRIIYSALVLVTIMLGLSTRHHASQLPRLIGDYAPDALWAVMMYWLWAMCFPRWPVLRVAAVALLVSYLNRRPRFSNIQETTVMLSGTPRSIWPRRARPDPCITRFASTQEYRSG